MLGSTLATVPGATVDWNCKGLMTFPLSLLGTKVWTQHLIVIFKWLLLKNNANLYNQLPSLLLSVHIQTLDGGSVPHVVPTGTFGSICQIHVQLLLRFICSKAHTPVNKIHSQRSKAA